MARTCPVLSLPILCFAIAGAAAGELAADEGERLSKVGSMIFVGGRLTDVVTPNPQPLLELSHGYRFLDDLATGTWDSDIYWISQKPYSSYEAVVDSTSGDIGPTLQVDRIVTATSTVLQSSAPIGVGFSRSLRWMNTTGVDNNFEAVRVRSGQCTTDCGPDDVYFIRGYETTYSIPRFNNSGTQITVLLLQNPTSYLINGNIYLWDTAGALVATQSFSLFGKQILVVNTNTIAGASGLAGTVTIANDGRYGDLSAKTVALEPATGFSFDSPALPRIR
jgi:hypothetical protein